MDNLNIFANKKFPGEYEMSDIFLSYKREDKEIAHKIAEVIKQEGYSVWVDRIIPPGKEFYKVIEEEIKAASCVVVLWSNRSIESIEVKTEAKAGYKREILIPVLIEDVEQPFEFTLIEAADLVEWDGTSSHDEFKLLLDSIGILKRSKLPENGILKQDEKEVEVIKKKELASNDKDIQVLGTFEREVEVFKKDNTTSKVKDTPVLNKPIYEIMQERMVKIPAGNFERGDNRNNCKEVTISAFKMDKFLVTQSIYEMVIGENPSHFEGKDRPVENVTWFDAIKFCNELSRNVGLQEAYEFNKETVERKLESDGYRLPTEAEWEYACRANSIGKRYGKLDEIAIYNTKSTHEVGVKNANEFGLYDMLGNVKEWCFDRYGDYPRKNVTNPEGPNTGPFRILRGGCWFSFPNEMKCPHRSKDWPNTSKNNVGFRLVLPQNQK